MIGLICAYSICPMRMQDILIYPLIRAGWRRAGRPDGQIYARGDGINSDPKQSRDWLERAYRLGRQDAPYQLLASYVKEGMKKQDGKWYIETGFRPFILKWARVAEQTDYDPKKREDAAAIIIMIENSESE